MSASLSGDESLHLPEFDAPPASPIDLARKWLDDAASREVSEPMSMTLATAGADGRVSEFKSILPGDENLFVFVRRCERPSAILRGTELVYGHRPEWIVLEFFDAGKRVNISSISALLSHCGAPSSEARVTQAV